MTISFQTEWVGKKKPVSSIFTFTAALQDSNTTVVVLTCSVEINDKRYVEASLHDLVTRLKLRFKHRTNKQK